MPDYSLILIMVAPCGILNLSKNRNSRIQASQNQYICFCLQLDKITLKSQKEFEAIGCPLKKDTINV